MTLNYNYDSGENVVGSGRPLISDELQKLMFLKIEELYKDLNSLKFHRRESF